MWPCNGPRARCSLHSLEALEQLSERVPHTTTFQRASRSRHTLLSRPRACVDGAIGIKCSPVPRWQRARTANAAHHGHSHSTPASKLTNCNINITMESQLLQNNKNQKKPEKTRKNSKKNSRKKAWAERWTRVTGAHDGGGHVRCARSGCEKKGSKRCGGCKQVCVSHQVNAFCIQIARCPPAALLRPRTRSVIPALVLSV
jgi:hypothetical protein